MNQTADMNKAAVRRFVEEIKNQRKIDQMGDVFHADYQEHNLTVNSFGGGVTGYQKFLTHLFSAFPQDNVKIDLIVAEGDMVVYHGTETGTHSAEFLGIPATGRSATWTEIQFFRFQDGKVAEHWIDVDLFSWFQQLGVIPAMGG
jgi:steroid delta-isomerase-like uncharacterized protein